MESLKIEEICTGIIILVSKIVPNFLQINENQKKIPYFFHFINLSLIFVFVVLFHSEMVYLKA